MKLERELMTVHTTSAGPGKEPLISVMGERHIDMFAMELFVFDPELPFRAPTPNVTSVF